MPLLKTTIGLYQGIESVEGSVESVISKYNELRADKEYIQILYFAFKHGEEKVANILQGILEEHTLLTMDTVKAKLNIQVKIPHINIPKPSLLSFDKFLSKVGGLVCLVTPLF